MSDSPTTVWYFAYGSNMETATFRGRRGIQFVEACAGRVSGFRLVLDKPPLVPINEAYANLVEDAGAETLGVLYRIAEADLAHVDLTEGVPLGNYRRIEVKAELLASPGAVVVAATLVSDRRDPNLLPSRRYLGCLISGAEEHGLPADYVAYLRTIPACEESEEAKRWRPLLDRAMRRDSSTGEA